LSFPSIVEEQTKEHRDRIVVVAAFGIHRELKIGLAVEISVDVAMTRSTECDSISRLEPHLLEETLAKDVMRRQSRRGGVTLDASVPVS
jgi:hypothetical protein